VQQSCRQEPPPRCAFALYLAMRIAACLWPHHKGHCITPELTTLGCMSAYCDRETCWVLMIRPVHSWHKPPSSARISAADIPAADRQKPACVALWLQALERGYWPSYNVPYSEDIYRRSGYPDAVKRVKALGPHYHDIVTGGRLLDVGCAPGVLCWIGWTPICCRSPGVESAPAVENSHVKPRL
jgi:hypothetical protein